MLKTFDEFPFNHKIVFTSTDYGLKSQVVFKECQDKGVVANDTLHFRKYIYLERWLKCEGNYIR